MNHMNNVGAQIKSVVCGMSSAVAAGTGDNTAVTGATVDRLGYESAKITVGYLTTLTAQQTLSLAVEYQDSDDDSNWNTAVALQASTVMETGAKTGELDEVSFSLDLRGLARYVRVNFTPDLSHGSVDTALTYAQIDLGGAAVEPAV